MLTMLYWRYTDGEQPPDDILLSLRCAVCGGGTELGTMMVGRFHPPGVDRVDGPQSLPLCYHNSERRCIDVIDAAVRQLGGSFAGDMHAEQMVGSIGDCFEHPPEHGPRPGRWLPEQLDLRWTDEILEAVGSPFVSVPPAR